MKQSYHILLFFLLFSFSAVAQEEKSEKEEPNKGFLVNASYGFNLPLADLSQDFGVHSDIGFGLEYYYDRFIFGLESNFIFGSKVKNDVLAKLRGEDGGIPTANGELGLANLSERGMYLGLHAGRIFPLSSKNPRSGIRLSLGTGFLQHKVKIEDISGAITQLAGEYIKGYDHLTNGWGVKEFVGYHYLSNSGRLNFFFGMEGTQAFTQNRRDFNFDTLMKDETKRFDSYVGFRVGWTIAIYTDYAEDTFYY